MRRSRKVGNSQVLIGGVLDYDGAPITLQGLRRRPFHDIYYYLVNAPWPAVLLSIAGAFAAANELFALG